MKRIMQILLVGSFMAVLLSACGGGSDGGVAGGGGGSGGGGSGGSGGGSSSTQTRKVMLFGNLSTNYSVSAVTVTFSAPGFTSYSASASDPPGIHSVRSNVLTSTAMSSVSGSYDLTNSLLTLAFTNGSQTALVPGSSGTEIGTVVISSATTLPAVSTLLPASGGEFTLTPSFRERTFTGYTVKLVN